MFGFRSVTRWVAFGTVVASLGLWLTPAPAGDKGNPNPGLGILPPGSDAYGATYAEWNARFWQWAILQPTAHHPLYDTAPYDAGQEGNKVIFIGGTFSANPQPDGSVLGQAERSITIPVGTALFFPILNSECSTLEGNGTTYAELAACAKGSVDHITGLEASIDGVAVQNLESYRAGLSPLFMYGPLPADNLLAQTTGDYVTYYAGATSPSVADGYCLLLAPLSPGEHTIHFAGMQVYSIDAGDPFNFIFKLDITYHITVSSKKPDK